MDRTERFPTLRLSAVPTLVLLRSGSPVPEQLRIRDYRLAAQKRRLLNFAAAGVCVLTAISGFASLCVLFS